MAIAAYFDLDITQFDAINAFTNALIDELIYRELPEGFKIPNKCVRLNKASYGLKQSPLLWFNDLSSTLLDMGFQQLYGAPCVFVNGTLIVYFFLDNIAVLSHKVDRAEA